MTHELMETTHFARFDSLVAQPIAANDSEVAHCIRCVATVAHTCHRCGADLCDSHSYHEEGETLYYCRKCADELVGVCSICDALHARRCCQCGLKVCEAHQKQVVEQWGWGGASGQGDVTNWFPVIQVYCQEHGQTHLNSPQPQPSLRTAYRP